MKGINNYLALILLSALLLIISPISKASGLTVAAANSTCDVMKKVGELFQQQQDINLDFICKSSGRLAKGLVGQAITADVFISANKRWMDYMVDGGAVKPESITSPWGNTLVVAAPESSSLVLDKWTDLQAAKIKVIMIGDPGTAPFGRHAKQAMETTRIWENVRKKIQTKKHITLLAETLAVSDTKTVGILFKTNVNDDLKVLYTIDKSWHKPIRYYMAPVIKSENIKGAKSFLQFIRDSEVSELMEASGFQIINW